MRDQGIKDAAIDRDLVFQSTLTFLYRLMFVLYAESRELVPVKDEIGYSTISLKTMKSEIANHAGKLIDAADDKLDDAYRDDSTELYNRLRRLFAYVDKGSADFNLPVYNGGLFNPEDTIGSFLNHYAISDRYLARGLDRLARDIDGKTHDLVFIDFKSLGVQHLGSIYEGLLEFKLRIASEKLAVIKDGKREIYVPYRTLPGADANVGAMPEQPTNPTVGAKRRFAPTTPPTEGPGVRASRNILDVVNPGKVYIENTKQERKATGSYYTPDYIVKYIVEHTVGPVLDAKFKALRPRLDAAQREYRQHKQHTEAKNKIMGATGDRARRGDAGTTDGPNRRGEAGITDEPNRRGEAPLRPYKYNDDTPTPIEDPVKFWNRADMRQLADDCLNIRVLDPAMGSGHFLVEVVDFVSSRLIDFLNGWSENPVWALLERTRADILGEMERQGVSVDEGKLTRVILLKRAVLKRCVYGVDLNAMAVELAKVSLWLDAFTLGAPLSFLDHHLKCGNSLIGARITEVQDYLSGGEGPQQIDMFAGSEFAGVMLATDLMRQVSYLSDNTVSQVKESRESFANASKHLAPYKRLLDVYTSRWFGNGANGGGNRRGDDVGAKRRFAPTTPTTSAAPDTPAKRAKGGKTDNVKLFLKQADVNAWLKDPRKPLDSHLIPATQIGQTALQAAADKRFFHWELEFPEVFFAPSTPGGQDVQLRNDGGFDAVVGNPPYVRSEGIGDDRVAFENCYKVFNASADLYTYFFERGHLLLNPNGRLGLITPNKFLRAAYGQPLRAFLKSSSYLDTLVDFGELRVFADAATDPMITLLGRVVIAKPTRYVQIKNLNFSSLRAVIEANAIGVLQTALNDSGWSLVSINQQSIFDKIAALGIPLEKYTSKPIRRGLITGLNEAFVIDQSTRNRLIAQDPKSSEILRPFLVGDDVRRYSTNSQERYLIWTYIGVPIKQYPAIFNHLKQYEVALEKRWDKGNHWWELRPCEYYDEFKKPKIIYPDIAMSSRFTLDKDGYFSGNTTYFIQIDDYYLTALLNAKATWTYLKKLCTALGDADQGGRLRMFTQFIEQLPIRRIDFTTPADRRAQLAEKGRKLYERCLREGHACVLDFTAHHLSLNETDVIHDLLAFLAQQMIDLNKYKQAEVKRFLGWLEGTLRIKPAPGKGGGDASDATVGAKRRFAPTPTPAGGSGIDSLKKKSYIQNYLGDYQKGEPEASFEDFYYWLYDNRTRFGVSLPTVIGAIEDEYRKSLAVLLPIKRQLATTDALIDRVVYQLYGLTDEEIKLIEYPQFEQAVTAAREDVLKEKAIKPGTDEAVEKIAEKVEQAAEQYLARVDETQIEAQLRTEIAGWDSLPENVRTFLITGDLLLQQSTLPDYSPVVISFGKAAEAILNARLFIPFRQTYSPDDCVNAIFQRFMTSAKTLSLGTMPIVLTSSAEKALRGFVLKRYPGAAQTILDPQALLAQLTQDKIDKYRNSAAHDAVLTADDAQEARQWAIAILGYV